MLASKVISGSVIRPDPDLASTDYWPTDYFANSTRRYRPEHSTGREHRRYFETGAPLVRAFFFFSLISKASDNTRRYFA